MNNMMNRLRNFRLLIEAMVALTHNNQSVITVQELCCVAVHNQQTQLVCSCELIILKCVCDVQEDDDDDENHCARAKNSFPHIPRDSLTRSKKQNFFLRMLAHTLHH